MRKEILIVGTGGQGVKTLAEIIGKAASYDHSLWPACYSLYTPAARGGEIISSVVIADQKTAYPFVEKPDFIIMLADNVPEKFLGSEAYWIFGMKAFVPKTKPKKYLALKNITNDPLANLTLLGIMQKLVPELEEENVTQAIKKILGEKRYPDNIKAFEKGQEFIK